jgi:glutamate-1-semialdehyde 2,1-aminomutase
VTPGAVADTLTAPFNDLVAVESLFDVHDDIAAVILEPVVGNMGLVLPEPGFLAGLRELTTARGALLVFDEVMTGFRVAAGGAQALYGITPDLTTLGKVIGGGLPVGAYGGRREIMELVAPAGPVYQAGTLSGNPLALSAGLAQLRVLDEANGWKRLEELGAYLEAGLRQILRELSADLALNRVGSMMTLFFTEGEVADLDSAVRSDTKRHGVFFREMLERGVHLPPSQFEALFVSLAHATDDLDRTLEAARESLKRALEA